MCNFTSKLILFFICLQVILSENKNEDEFIPTQQWQIVKKGQKIPKGLHIRVNFATGKTEAKLLDEDKPKQDNALVEIPTDPKTENLLDTEVIKEALKKLKNDDNLKHSEDEKKYFRSYEQIKEDLSELNVTAKVDSEVMAELLQQYKREMGKNTLKYNEHAISRILEDIDFLAHQFDNGFEFVRQNGFNEIIYRNLNITSEKIRADTLRLFGSLTQNNAKVQIHALETGSIPILLRILNSESSITTKSRAVFALGCLIRRFPLAQLYFIQNGGVFIVTNILDVENPIKIKMKLVTLMNDLLLENSYAMKDRYDGNQDISASQYKLVNLEDSLLEQNWCEYLNRLLISILATDPENHDILEKCLTSMHTVAKKCSASFSGEILVKLKRKYEFLSTEDYELNGNDSSDFLSNISKLSGEILYLVNFKTEL